MAKKLIDRKDITNDLVNVVAPKYFPEETLDKNRVSIMGYLTEAMATSIEDTVTLEQRRAADYCPELSNSSIHVRQTAKIRSVNAEYAKPAKAFAIIGVLKDDILTKGVKSGNEIVFTIDRRSTIMHNGVPFSLEDDIIIRAVQRPSGYVYAANYSGEYATYESYIQMFEQQNTQGQEMVSLLVQIYQFSYNIREQIVTDEIQFMYDGIPFDYENRLSGFDVYYKNSTSDTYVKVDKIHYLTTETTNAIYYNDDDDEIIFIMNNPKLNIGVNAMLKVEIRETLGLDGMVTIGNGNTTFSLYRDGTYNYTGVNIIIEMLSDAYDATDGDSLEDIKHRLIDAKTRRDNITTEHDIISYINDIDANVQIIKKRNDIEDRRYYMYTLLRYQKEIVPAATKRLRLTGVISPLNIGDFDRWDSTVDRKVLRAYNKFKLIESIDPDEEDYAVKVDRNEEEDLDGFYYTCPFMILLNKYNIASYYFTSVNDSIVLNGKGTNSLFPFQMICKSLDIYRDSHNPATYDQYRCTITGTLNTSNDNDLLDEDGNLKDTKSIMAYIIFRRDNNPVAYLPMEIHEYNSNTREFTFTGSFVTTDYITEQDRLEVTTGLFKNSTELNYNSVIDFKDAQLEVYFMYKYDQADDYLKGDPIFQYLPSSLTDGYALMCGYYNTPSNYYNLLLEYNKFSSSPVKVLPRSETTVYYSIGEVPFIKYDYGIDHIIDMYDTFENMKETYGSLLKLTTDFEVSLKFINTYGRSRYIRVTGGRDPSTGEEIIDDLNDLNPTFYFKVYGKNVNLEDVRQFIYEYLRDTYITGTTIFMSNICTLIEQTFTSIKSIKYMGVNKFDASYQQFTYEIPKFLNVDIITRFVPEQLNVTNIQIDLDET